MQGLTGSRIREHRSMAGLKQAELAAQIGISASYLNLIEHNRRRIGGKLLLNIASVLNVDAQLLSEGTEAALLAQLRAVAKDCGLAEADAARADDFAGRFPAWADALADTRRRLLEIEGTVEALQDRLSHDPHLADTIHELLSTVAAVRSTAAILADTKSLKPEWRDRFHANIDEDSRRLSEGAQALVRYLDVKGEGTDALLSPVEEVSAFVSAHRYAFVELEAAEAVDDQKLARLVRAAPQLVSQAARNGAVDLLAQVMRDAEALPLPRLAEALRLRGPDPLTLAANLDCSVAVVLRRLASLPDLDTALVLADRVGNVVMRKTAAHFSVLEEPRSPLFAALGTPGLVVAETLAGTPALRCFATAQVQPVSRYNTAPQVQGVLLMLAAD